MTRYLLDTHTAIWCFDNVASLSQIAGTIIRNLSNSVYISIASAWELSIKIGIGKLSFPDNVAGFLRTAQVNRISILSIKGEHLLRLEALPLFHRDTFDRLLIATAICEELTLITADSNIAQYDVSQVW